MDSATDCCGISYKKEFVLRTPKVPPMAPNAAMFEKVVEDAVLVEILVIVLGERGLLRVAVILARPTVTLYRLQLGLSNGNVPHMDRTLELDKREKLLSAAVLRKLRGCVVDDVGAKTA